MNADEIMVQPVVTVERSACLEDIAKVMLAHGFGSVPVVDDQGRLCGIVSESDFAARERGVPFSTLRLPQVFNQWMPPRQVERLYQAARTITAKEIMTTDVVTVSPETSIEDVIRRMLDHEINHVPVVRDGIPVGIISRHDLLRLMVDKGVS